MFRLIEDSFWDDPPIAKLSRDEKLILVCLFTNVHTRPCGIYRLALDRLARMVKVPEAVVMKWLKALSIDDLVYYDGLEVCIPGYIRRQRYKGPQMARRIVLELDQVKNKSYVKKIAERYPDFLRSGGFKLDKLEYPPEQKELAIEEPATPKKSKNAGLADLGLFIAQRLKFTGGVKPSVLARLVSAVEGEQNVRSGVERAFKYYATAKAEKWHSFVIARRFSKFCDYFGEAFSSDEVLEEYIVKIRAANAREAWKLKKDNHLQVGAQRVEPAEKPARVLTPEQAKAEEIKEIRDSIERSNKFLEDPHKKVKPQERKIVLKNIEGYQQRLKELE